MKRTALVGVLLAVASATAAERLAVKRLDKEVLVGDEKIRLYQPEVIVAGVQDGPDGLKGDKIELPATPQASTEACYNDSEDCGARAKYVCDENGLDPLGHGGVRTAVFSADTQTCSIECKDGTTATCTPDSSSRSPGRNLRDLPVR